jgi:hypothetical protein
MAMEEQPEPAALPAAGRKPNAAAPAAPSKPRRLRWKSVVIGAAAVVVVGAALALVLPRVLGGTSIAGANPTAAATSVPEAAPTVAGSGECITLTDCLAQAFAAKQAGAYEDAIEAYTRAQHVVPTDRYPAYAFLWCEMAQANLALDQQELALDNFQRCVDWTQGTSATVSLRTEAEIAIHNILGGTFADGVLNYGPSGDVNRNCANPASALGSPDFDPNHASTYLCLGVRGVVELEFINNVPIDGPGPDIKVHGDPGNDDSWHVDVSADGDTWLHFVPQPEVVQLDLAKLGLSRIRFIRFTDTGTGNNGAELDAVEALNWEPAG